MPITTVQEDGHPSSSEHDVRTDLQVTHLDEPADTKPKSGTVQSRAKPQLGARVTLAVPLHDRRNGCGRGYGVCR